jgi:signal transduction histidine kinase/HAMP domain-containing protein
MSLAQRLHNLPLRIQWSLAFALLCAAPTAISTITLATLSEQRMHDTLSSRSERIANRLQSQLQSVVAFEDHATARSIFDSYSSDRELDGIAVYSGSGDLIEGRGYHPGTLTSQSARISPDAHHVIAVANIASREGKSGHLYLSFSTKLNETVQRRDAWIAASIGTGVVLGALILALLITGRIALRLERIANAARRMAAGDFSQPCLEDQGKDEISALSRAFNFMVSELNRLSREHEQLVLTERERLENLVAERTLELEKTGEMFRLIAESTKAIPFTLDLTRNCFPYVGAHALFESTVREVQLNSPGTLDLVIPRKDHADLRRRFDDCTAGPFEFESVAHLTDGRRVESRWSGTCEFTADAKYLRGLMQDITDFRRLGRELAAAQKLEAVGRLAAGVAHEINTPVQFVSDNVQFLRTVILDITTVIDAYRNVRKSVQSTVDQSDAVRTAVDAEAAVELDFLLENAPLAIDASLEGLGRIATIVRSMREFAHPDQAQKCAADLNKAIQSTLVIAHNEYKYVAELDAQFDDLPPVPCFLGEINQVILNLIINAAHAMADRVKETGALGRLTVRTSLEGEVVVISIGDTGVGIPEAVKEKIFDPFFTTKEVGKGTGQGLAIARSVVVNKHGGSIRFESECGRGTTFFVRLPLEAPDVEPHQMVAA